MCIQVIERYAVCRCLYYKHAVDLCPQSRKAGHGVRTQEVLVGYTCSKHSSSSVQRPNPPRARHQVREVVQDQTQLVEVDDDKSSDDVGAINGLVPSYFDPERSKIGAAPEPQPRIDLITRLTAVLGEISCPYHPSRNIGECPRECSWNIEEAVEKGRPAGELSAGRFEDSGKSVLVSKPKTVSSREDLTAITKNGLNIATDCGAESIELRAMQSHTDSSHSQTSVRHNPAVDRDILVAASIQTKIRLGTLRKLSKLSIRPCYILIFLGLLTVIGSLVPAIWRASARDDMSGGFSLAQYILGVGIFAVGSMVAMHSKNCECWKKKDVPGSAVNGMH